MNKKKPFLKFFTYFFLCFLIIVVSLVAAEITARYLEPETITPSHGLFASDHVFGWLPKEGNYRMKSSDYDVTYRINSWGMNDRQIIQAPEAALKIMVLGDSHTFAYGVLQEDSWSKVLEKTVFKGDCQNGIVYNCAVPGFNLGQYLLRMRQLEGTIRPDIVIIGFSMATDLYDFLPPRMGGFIYGDGLPRVYFDLDKQGNLVELPYKPENRLPASANLQSTCRRDVFAGVRIEDFALFRRFRNSILAVWIGMRLKDQHRFFGSDAAFRKVLDGQDAYCWKMTEMLLKKIAQEAHQKKRTVILVNIPYLAQVYDDVWRFSYGSMPEKYDRWIGQKRLAAICERSGISFIDATPGFIKKAGAAKTRLHYPLDKHPTIEGHKSIAEAVSEFLTEDRLKDIRLGK